MPFSLGVAVLADFRPRRKLPVALQRLIALGADGSPLFWRPGVPSCLVSCLRLIAPRPATTVGPWTLFRGNKNGRSGPLTTRLGKMLPAFRRELAPLQRGANFLARLFGDGVANGDVRFVPDVQAFVSRLGSSGIKVKLLALNEQ